MFQRQDNRHYYGFLKLKTLINDSRKVSRDNTKQKVLEKVALYVVQPYKRRLSHSALGLEVFSRASVSSMTE